MKAVIFAAGLGTRLRPLTDTTPKPLIPVAGKPILLRTFEALPAAIDETVVVIGYKGEMVREALAGMTGVSFVEQPELKGTYDALVRARPHLGKGAFLVLNGDDLYAKADLERLIAAPPTAMLAHSVARPNPYSHLETDGELLTCIVPNADIPVALPFSRTYVGAAVLTSDFFDLEPKLLPNGESGLPQTLEKHLSRFPVRVIESTFWMPVGTPEELASAQLAFDTKTIP